jgi:hypothetical protein
MPCVLKRTERGSHRATGDAVGLVAAAQCYLQRRAWHQRHALDRCDLPKGSEHNDVAQFLTVCRAYHWVEAWRLSSLWQGSSPAQMRVSSRPSRTHGHNLRLSPNCKKWSGSGRAAHGAFLPGRPGNRGHSPAPGPGRRSCRFSAPRVEERCRSCILAAGLLESPEACQPMSSCRLWNGVIMTGLTATLAAFIRDKTLADVPPEALDKAKKAIAEASAVPVPSSAVARLQRRSSPHSSTGRLVTRSTSTTCCR